MSNIEVKSDPYKYTGESKAAVIGSETIKLLSTDMRLLIAEFRELEIMDSEDCHDAVTDREQTLKGEVSY